MQKIYEKIVESSYAPANRNVLWLRVNSDGSTTFLRNRNGEWIEISGGEGSSISEAELENILNEEY